MYICNKCNMCNICIYVRHVDFRWNLSILPRHSETISLVSHTFKWWVYVYTFLSLYEPFLLIFAIDLTFLLYFPSKNTPVAFKKCLYSKIHSTCFLTFKHLIMSIVFLYQHSCPSMCHYMVFPTGDIFE